MSCPSCAPATGLDGGREIRSLGAMRWFGEHWGAPVCIDANRVETPVGSLCLGCTKKVSVHDHGVLIPFVGTGTAAVVDKPWHLTCFLQALGIGTRKLGQAVAPSSR